MKTEKNRKSNCIYLNQLGQFCHEQRHLLCSRNDVVILAGPLSHLLVQVVGSHLEREDEVRQDDYHEAHHDGSLAGGGSVLEHVVRLVISVRRWWRPRRDVAAIVAT